jgi:hypothetical protein
MMRKFLNIKITKLFCFGLVIIPLLTTSIPGSLETETKPFNTPDDIITEGMGSNISKKNDFYFVVTLGKRCLTIRWAAPCLQ